VQELLVNKKEGRVGWGGGFLVGWVHFWGEVVLCGWKSAKYFVCVFFFLLGGGGGGVDFCTRVNLFV
jgi:hypothetical protein